MIHYRPHRNQPNHQRILGHGSKGQRFPKKHGPFPRSFLSQHKSRERRVGQRDTTNNLQPGSVVACLLGARNHAKPLLCHLLSAHTSHISPHCVDRDRGSMCMVIMGPASQELAFYSLLMSLTGAFSLAWLPPDSTPVSNQH